MIGTLTHPAPVDLEIAQAETAAIERARAALRARPPERCQRCNGQTFYPEPRDGWWRCRTCHGGTPGPLVTAAEEHEATTRAITEARAAVLEPKLDTLRHLIVVDERRDRRPLRALLPGFRDYLLHRAAPSRYPATAAMREWQHDRLLDLAQKHAEVTGHEDPFALKAVQLCPRILFRGFDGWTRAADGMLTTSDFPGLLDKVANTLVLDAYGDTVRSFESWTSAVTVADFRSTIATMVDFPDLLAVPEHGEYVAGNPFGPAVPLRLVNYGRIVQFTRQAVLRDDVASFGQLQQALGVAAAQVENDAVYDLLVSNPTMSDGVALFSTQHANLLPAGALSATSLGAACAQLATISNHGRPAFLVCGTKDGPTARQLVTAETPPNAGDASGVLEVVVDDRIPSGFYVTTDPAARPTMVTAHLAAADGPELLAQDAWHVDARSYKGRDEFGAAVVDWRSMVFTPAT
jgi:hypothetical protein